MFTTELPLNAFDIYKQIVHVQKRRKESWRSSPNRSLSSPPSLTLFSCTPPYPELGFFEAPVRPCSYTDPMLVGVIAFRSSRSRPNMLTLLVTADATTSLPSSLRTDAVRQQAVTTFRTYAIYPTAHTTYPLSLIVQVCTNIYNTYVHKKINTYGYCLPNELPLYKHTHTQSIPGRREAHTVTTRPP